MAAISFATLGMLMIAVVPTYDVIGIGAASAPLARRDCCRAWHTGEVASACTCVAEVAPPARRGLQSAIYVSLTAAIVAATPFGALLTCTYCGAMSSAILATACHVAVVAAVPGAEQRLLP